jgi:hypothetical protein
VAAIAKADRPSPNPVFGQLNDGVFYSFVFHDMRPPVSERDIRQNDDPVCPLVNLTIPPRPTKSSSDATGLLGLGTKPGSEIRRNVRPFTFAARRRAYPFAATRLAGADAQPENGI